MTQKYVRGLTTRIRPWWRPLAYSAATAAAIAMLFNPLPASAAPLSPPPAVPDSGSRPQPYGSVVLPGQQSTVPTTTAPTTITPTTSPISTPGVAMTPLLAKVEAGRAEIATLGEQLTKHKEDVDLSKQQLATADQKVATYSAAVAVAQAEVAKAAAASVRDAAAMPPGGLGSGLSDLDSLARINRGDSATEQAASRQLAIAQNAHAAALAEQQAVSAHLTVVSTQQNTLQKQVDKKSAAQQKLEKKHAAELRAAEAAQAALDARTGAGILGGSNAGRGADPRAVAALKIALAQRGDPYVWSEEGPNEFDCSGLMFYSYRSDAAGNFPLTRVSKDQYYQTRGKAVDRYSLLPGDLLFFSSSNSWKGIHHVAMYAGEGMMVEAPRTGLDVRLTAVRWGGLFGATRIYGSVEGTVEGPNLGAPDPEKPSDHTPPKSTPKPPTTTTPTPKPTSKPPKPPKPPKPSTSTPADPDPSTTPPTASPSPSTTTPSTTPATTPAPSATSSAATPDKPAEEDKPSDTDESATTSKTASASASAAAVAKSAGS